MRSIRDQIGEQRAGYKGTYRDFVILDETCAVLLGIEYTISMARIRLAKRHVG